ncbi:MAG: transcriptional regulator, partial [Achromobacter pestifer]
CLDWSERRSHLGGALGAALLDALEQRGWISKDLDSRALSVTRKGTQQFPAFFGKADASAAGGWQEGKHAAA